MPTGTADLDSSSLLEASTDVVLRGDTVGAVRLAHAAWQNATQADTVAAASRLTLLESYAGNIHHAVRWAAAANLPVTSQHRELTELAVGRGIVATETGAAEVSLDLTRFRDAQRLWPLAYWAQGRAELRHGNAFGATELADRADFIGRSAGRTSFARHLISVLRAEAAWAMGDVGRARVAVKDVPTGCTAAAAVRMRLSLAIDGAEEARRHSFWLAAQCEATPRARVPLLLGRAVAELEARPDEAARTADEAAALIGRTGLSSDVGTFPATAMAELAGRSEQLAQYVNGQPPTDGWPSDVQPVRLTPTELTVLRMLPHSTDQLDLAARLFLSHNTVKTHLRNLYAKLGVHRRHEAIERGVTLGLFHIN